MIEPRPGYIVVEKAKDNSKGYEVELQGFRNVKTGEIVYFSEYVLKIGDKYLVNEDAIVAAEVEDAN